MRITYPFARAGPDSDFEGGGRYAENEKIDQDALKKSLEIGRLEQLS